MNFKAINTAFAVFLLGLGTSLMVVASINDDLHKGIIALTNLLLASFSAYKAITHEN